MTSETGLERNKWCLFFDVCSKIEKLSAELYHFYSDVFLDNPDASRMWKKTALEEENHLEQIKMAERLTTEIDMVMPNGLEVACGIHAKLGRLVAGVKHNPPDLITALKKSIEMEERLAFLHMESALRFKNASMQQMFDALRASDREHISALKRQLAIESLARMEMSG